MFGYVRADTPYLYIKDETLYQAMYCGLCKGIAKACGQRARLGLSYDITFLSVILHNIAGVDVKIEKSHCLTHCIRSKKMAEVDELTKMLGAFNTALVYFKCVDDIADGDKGGAKRLFFKKGYTRVKKTYPQIENIMRTYIEAQKRAEAARTDSIDRAADATANMVAAFSDYALGDKATANTRGLFYAVGKWIYLIDALDDYDKDRKKDAYNPFVLAYNAESKETLLKSEKAEEVRFAFHALFYDIREHLSQIRFYFNRDLSDNILLRGLPAATRRVMEGCHCDKKRDRTGGKADTK